MAKKRISFDIDIPDGYTGRAKKKKKKRKAARKKAAGRREMHKALFEVPAGQARELKLIMPRQAGKKGAKKPKAYNEAYSQYKKKLLDLAVDFIDDEFGIIVEWVKDILSLKRRVKAITWYIVFLTAGMAMILYGLATYLNCLCPQFACGLSYVIIGLIALLLGMVCKKVFA